MKLDGRGERRLTLADAQPQFDSYLWRQWFASVDCGKSENDPMVGAWV
jgi:hypothetical protein